MSISNQEKAQQAVKRLQEWIESKPKVPICKGRINKTAICKINKITRSTVGSNKELEAIFNNLESSIISYPMQDIRGEKERQLQKYINNLEIKLALAEKEIKELKGKIEINEHLLDTGRVIEA